MVDHSDKKEPNVQNEILMILEGATSQIQVFVPYIPVYSLGKLFIMYYNHLSYDSFCIFEAVVNEIFSKMIVTIKFWTS